MYLYHLLAFILAALATFIRVADAVFDESKPEEDTTQDLLRNTQNRAIASKPSLVRFIIAQVAIFGSFSLILSLLYILYYRFQTKIELYFDELLLRN